MDTRDKVITGVSAAAPAVGTAVGAGLGSIIPGAGTAVGAMLGGAAGGMIGGIAQIFRKPKVRGPGGLARGEEAIARLRAQSMPESLTPSELSALAEQETAAIAEADRTAIELSMNPNVPATTLMHAESEASLGLRSLLQKRGLLRGEADAHASRARTDARLQALGNYASIAARNTAELMRAQTMMAERRTAQWQSFGQTAAAAAQTTVAAVALQGKQAEAREAEAVKDQAAAEELQAFQDDFAKDFDEQKARQDSLSTEGQRLDDQFYMEDRLAAQKEERINDWLAGGAR